MLEQLVGRGLRREAAGASAEAARVDTVYESAVERQFSTAQINTVISVISKSVVDDGHRMRFVSLQDEFDAAMADAGKRRETLMGKCEVLNASLGSADRSGRRKFVGDKWGAKYLRAPDIYRTVLAKGEGRLVRLDSVVEVKRGITTGANKFFYVSDDDANEWGIESDFLKPVMTSPQESRVIEIDPTVLRYKLFTCRKTRDQLVGTGAADYIRWGESAGFHERRSMAGRRFWYDLGERAPVRLAMNKLVESTVRTYLSVEGMLFTDTFQVCYIRQVNPIKLCAAMNSTMFQLIMNTEGRANFGEGVLEIQTYETAGTKIVALDLLPNSTSRFFVRTAGT